MSKFKQAKIDLWDSHIKRATTSPEYAKEYHRKDFVLDHLQINANKIKNREAVGDQYLFGLLAAELVDGGYVTEAELRPYREALLADIAKYKNHWVETKESKKDNAKIIRFNPFEEIKAALYHRHARATEIIKERNNS